MSGKASGLCLYPDYFALWTLFLLLLIHHFVRIVFWCLYFLCWLSWWQQLKRTPHLNSEEVFLATNLSTKIERNPTVSDSVRWIDRDRPNGSHSACTETMVPYRDGDRKFLWELASKPLVYPFPRRSVRSFSLRRRYVVKEDQKQPPLRLHRWWFVSIWSKPPYCSTKSQHAWVNAWPNSQLLSSYLQKHHCQELNITGLHLVTHTPAFRLRSHRSAFPWFLRNPPRARRTTRGSLPKTYGFYRG